MFIVRLFRNENLAFSGFVNNYIDHRILVFGRNCSFLLRLLVFRRRSVPLGGNFFFFARHFADFDFSHFWLHEYLNAATRGAFGFLVGLINEGFFPIGSSFIFFRRGYFTRDSAQEYWGT